MNVRSWIFGLACVVAAGPAWAQVRPDSRFEILRVMIADNAASRIVMPLGSNGVELSAAGEVNQQRLDRELREEGRSIDAGEVVTITAISFNNDRIEVELNGGGTVRRSFLDRIQIGIGGNTTPIRDAPQEEAKGSKVVLRFDDRAPAELTVDELKTYLSPVLDFNKQNFMDSGIESLPVEFQEAVQAKEARIGMDRSTVLMARGRPDRRVWETVDGIDREDWIYFGVGLTADFITFDESGVVIKIVRY